MRKIIKKISSKRRGIFCFFSITVKKNSGDLGQGRGRMINTPDRRESVQLITQAISSDVHEIAMSFLKIFTFLHRSVLFFITKFNMSSL